MKFMKNFVVIAFCGLFAMESYGMVNVDVSGPGDQLRVMEEVRLKCIKDGGKPEECQRRAYPFGPSALSAPGALN